MIPSVHPRVRVLIVSSQPIVRAGMAALLRPCRERLQVVSEVDGVDSALEEASRSHPHVMLVDVRVGGAEGVELVGRLVRAAHPCRVVVLARQDEARFTWPALRRGAVGFLLDGVGGAELAGALEEVGSGAIAVDSSLAGGSRGQSASGPPPRWPGSHLGLTEKESQILELMALGESPAGVSGRLGITRPEVKAHVRSACRRLHVRDRPDALATLAREGLFS